jgi:nicotinamidase-related amidase
MVAEAQQAQDQATQPETADQLEGETEAPEMPQADEEKESDTILWRVDAEKDFMLPDGLLSVFGDDKERARKVAANMQTVTEAADEYDARAVYTGDLHTMDDDEIVEDPEDADFDDYYPMHCERGSEGAEFIDEVVRHGYDAVREHAKEIDFQVEYTEDELREAVNQYRDILLRKNRFDVFQGTGTVDDGSTYADLVVDEIEPEKVVMDGVAADVCVDRAIEGLLKRGVDVYLVEDATEGINDGVEDCADDWNETAAGYDAEFNLIQSDQVGEYLE